MPPSFFLSFLVTEPVASSRVRYIRRSSALARPSSRMTEFNGWVPLQKVPHESIHETSDQGFRNPWSKVSWIGIVQYFTNFNRPIISNTLFILPFVKFHELEQSNISEFKLPNIWCVVYFSVCTDEVIDGECIHASNTSNISNATWRQGRQLLRQ